MPKELPSVPDAAKKLGPLHSDNPIPNQLPTPPHPPRNPATVSTRPLPPASPPPPAAPRLPRAPLSRTTKLIIGSVALVVIMGAGVGLFLQQKVSQPPVALLLTTLDRDVGAEKLRFQTASPKFTRLDANRVKLTFTAEGKLSEALYQLTDINTALAAEIAAALPRLTEADRVLASRSGAKLRESAGLGEPPADPRQAALLRATAKTDEIVRYEGEALATRGQDGWSLQLLEGHFPTPPPEGEPRGSFGAKTYVADDIQDLAALKALIAARLAYAERALAAATKFAAQLAEDRRARLQQFQAQLKPGTLFTGSARNLRDAKTQSLTLEITAFNATAGTLNAVLRNDGGWSDTRAFQGNWKADEEVEHMAITLGTRQNQAVPNAGPFLEVNDTFALDFTLTDSGSLKAATRNYEFSFNRVSEAEAAGLRAQLAGEITPLISATAKDVVYRGAAISKNSQASEPVLLHFTRQDNDGALLQATLTSPDHATWRRQLRGTLIANRYRSNDQPVRLQLNGQDHIARAPNQSVFAYGYDLSLKFAVAGNQLTGEDNRFDYRLTRVTDAELAQFKAEREAREKRFLNVLRVGAVYDGAVINARAGATSRLRLRVRQIEPASKTIVVRLESREQTGTYYDMSGSYEPVDGTLALGGTGLNSRSIPWRKQNVPPFFYWPERVYQANLQLSDEGLTGELNSYEWTFNIPIGAMAAQDQTTDVSTDFPVGTGAYVKGADGQWLLLPGNGGATHAASQVLKGISGLLGSVSIGGKPLNQGAQSTPDKVADLTFTGNTAVPAVTGDDVVIVFIGDLKPIPANLLQSNPELADYPPMELAATHTAANGNRKVDLLRIVPGLAGFREARIAATLDQPKPGVWLLTCTSRLAPGTYALAAGENYFELRIR
jgi:hypothetical protein